MDDFDHDLALEYDMAMNGYFTPDIVDQLIAIEEEEDVHMLAILAGHEWEPN